jgi:hypothetical protein
MKYYKNLNQDSGVVAYEIGRKNIKVQFRDGSIYNYTYESAGKEQVEQMKKLAVEGRGLATYINKQVRERYALKIV